MDNEIMFPIILIACLAVVIFIRVMASKDHLFGRICRGYWNASCAISAMIPFLGLISRIPFLGPVKNHRLQVFVNDVSSAVSGIATEMLEEAVRIEQAQAARDRAIRDEISRRGGDCAEISYDGTSATYTDKYGNVCHAHVEYR